MSSSRKDARKFSRFITEINKTGYAKLEGSLVLASAYVMRILDENDPLHDEYHLNLLKNCKILTFKEGDYLVIRRELIKLGQNPTESKFINMS